MIATQAFVSPLATFRNDLTSLLARAAKTGTTLHHSKAEKRHFGGARWCSRVALHASTVEMKHTFPELQPLRGALAYPAISCPPRVVREQPETAPAVLANKMRMFTTRFSGATVIARSSYLG